MILIYQEKQKTYFILIAVFIMIAVFFLTMIFFPRILGNEEEMSQAQRIVVLIAVVVDLILFWSFSNLSITLTNEELKIGFGIFKKKFKLSDIAVCSIEDFKLSRYWGYGIRFGTDKSIGYVAKAGRGVRIKSKHGKDYFFTTDQPEQLLSLLNQYLSK